MKRGIITIIVIIIIGGLIAWVLTNNKKENQQKLLDELNSRKDEIMAIIEANEENLVSYPLSIINSDSSSISEIQNAINTLQYMLPQLNSDYVIDLVNAAIDSGNYIISFLLNFLEF